MPTASWPPDKEVRATIPSTSTSTSTSEPSKGFVTSRRKTMSLGFILLIVLIVLLIGAVPSWPHSRSWGYGPSGGLGLVVIIVIVLLLMGRL